MDTRRQSGLEEYTSQAMREKCDRFDWDEEKEGNTFGWSEWWVRHEEEGCQENPEQDKDQVDANQNEITAILP